MCYSKKVLLERDNYTCQYCGNKVNWYKLLPNQTQPLNSATLDHIIPKSKGGQANEINLITCCLECNWILKNKGYNKRNNNNMLNLYKCKKKIIKQHKGYIMTETPKHLLEYHQQYKSTLQLAF